ncbi:hypothetical protein BGX34_003572 [Mortierella sp. NVP85]|nr:hypothetical protein BGX34_003572 [Mortierella sp. NVP85]
MAQAFREPNHRQQQDTQTMLGTEEADNVQNPWSNWFYTATSTITGSVLSAQVSFAAPVNSVIPLQSSLKDSSKQTNHCEALNPATVENELVYG